MTDDNEVSRIGGYELKPLGKMFYAIWKAATHPVTGLIVAIAVGLGTYFLSKSSKEPVYVVGPTELIAQTVNGEGGLKIFWEGKEIENAASVKIAFWNQGSQYIDKNDVSTTDPVRFVSSGKVKILSVNQLASSRNAIKFSWRKEIDAQGNERAVLNLEGDEALEKFDGAAFHLLYSGPLNSPWAVTGRIKGVPDGFLKKEWSRVQPPLPSERRVLIPVTISLAAVMLLFVSYEFYARKKYQRPLRWWRIVFGILYPLVLTISAFSSHSGYLFAPHWLPK